MDNAFFWCGCQQAFTGEPPEKCQLHGDTVERITEHVEVVVEVEAPPPPKPKMKSKTKPSKR